MELSVLKWLTWAPHWDGHLGLLTPDHWWHVFHKMQLTTSRVDEESRAGMMIAGVCKPPTSDIWQRDRDVRVGVEDCVPGAGCAPVLSSHDSHTHTVLEGA